MEMYAHLYRLYTMTLIRGVRFLLAVLLIVLILSSLAGGTVPKISIFLFGLFLMKEIFFRYHIGRLLPQKKVTDEDHPETMMTLQATALVQTAQRTSLLRNHLTQTETLRFLLNKIGITPAEILPQEVEWEKVIASAQALSKQVGGSYITTMDVVTAYLLLCEEKTKLLFSKKLKEEDVLAILKWTRMDNPDEEKPHQLLLHIIGGGLATGLLTGWTPETQKYTTNYTLALKRRPILVGREKEYTMLIDTLAKSEGNNTLLIGDIGVGKENLIQALAFDSYSGNLPDTLNYKSILELMVGQLIAGASQRSDLEERLQAIIDEISHSGNVILYIPEFQNIMGASSYQIDLSGALLPYLKEGKIPIVASISQGNYKRYLENNAVREVFTQIPLLEPEQKTAVLMLMEKASEIEKQEKVGLTYEAIVQAVKHADRYMQDGVLPGSAVRLLIDASHTVATSKRKPKLVMDTDVIAKVEAVTNIKLSAPKGQEKELLLHLEDKLHERVVDQVQAIAAISEAMRRVRTGMHTTNRPISFLFLGPTGVGKTETAKALSDLYYGGESNMIRLDMSEYSDEVGLIRLLGSLPGQGEERGELTDKIHDHPASLVLLDEFEKAHPKILDLFLQILDDGRLTDNKGKTVSFSNAIIIATSNAGAELIRESVQKGAVIDKKFQAVLLNYLQANRLFKPELLNRFDDVITFKPLGSEEIQAITKLYLNALVKQLAEEDITMTYDQAVIEKVGKEGFDAEFGARPLRRYIQDTIEDMIAKKKLSEDVKRGSKIAFSVDTTGKITLHTLS